MRRRVGQGSCPERGAYGGSALQGVCLKTIFECPLIGNGDSVIITNERHKAELLYARRVEPRVYRPLPCAQRMAGGFLFNRKLRSLLNKNAPQRSHCGGRKMSLSRPAAGGESCKAGFFLMLLCLHAGFLGTADREKTRNGKGDTEMRELHLKDSSVKVRICNVCPGHCKGSERGLASCLCRRDGWRLWT